MGTCSICKQQIKMIKNNIQVCILSLLPNHHYTFKFHFPGKSPCWQQTLRKVVRRLLPWLRIISIQEVFSFPKFVSKKNESELHTIKKFFGLFKAATRSQDHFKSPHASVLVLAAVIFSCDPYHVSQINIF